MSSIGSLNLLPPQTTPTPTAAAPPANAAVPSSPGDGSFGTALKRAKDRNSSPADDDGTQSAQAGTPSSNDAQMAASDPPDKTSADAKNQNDDATATSKADAGKPASADTSKKPAAGKQVLVEKQSDDAQKSGDQKTAEADAAEITSVEPVDAAGAKPGKKVVAKQESEKAAAGPVATTVAAIIDDMPKKVDLSKKTVSKSAGKITVLSDANAAGKPSKATAGAVDGVNQSADDSADKAATDSIAPGAGLVAKVSGQKDFNAKSKGSTSPTDASAAGVNAIAAAEAAGVSTTETGSAASASVGPVSAVGTTTSLAGDGSPATAALTSDAATPTGKTAETTLPAVPAVKLTAQQQFVEDNHPKIVTGVAGELLPDGGTMQIRLDPPELGAISVTIHIKAGVMSAAFETSNDDSTRMLTHSLSQLKTSLEATGVSVEKMQVQQSPKQEGKGTGDKDSGTEKQQDQQGQAKRDQQRQELIKRMWAKLAGGDPLDLVA